MPADHLAVPKCAKARGELYSEVLMEAVLTLRVQLRHPNAEIARNAAESILDLERTRMRHGKSISGVKQPELPYDGPLEPMMNSNNTPNNLDDDGSAGTTDVPAVLASLSEMELIDFREIVDKIQAHFQRTVQAVPEREATVAMYARLAAEDGFEMLSMQAQELHRRTDL